MATIKKVSKAKNISAGPSKKTPIAPKVDPKGQYTKVQERTLGNMKKGGKVKKAQNGNAFVNAVNAKKQLDANKNPTFTANFTNKKGVTNSYETDTTGFAAGKQRFPWKNTNTKNSKVRYGTASRANVAYELEKQGDKQKNGGKTSKNWIQSATASIKKRGTEGKCTPITKPGCTGKAKTLAKTFKKMAKKK